MKNELTRKDLEYYYNAFAHFRRGYCCYQDDNKSRWSLTEIGYNSGVYGWNWTLLADYETDTLYCTCYRNVPGRFVEK